MKNFNWNWFMNEKIVVHCDTEEKAEDFLKQCHNKGITWMNGKSLLKFTAWEYYKEYTYYIFPIYSDGIYFCRNKDNCEII